MGWLFMPSAVMRRRKPISTTNSPTPVRTADRGSWPPALDWRSRRRARLASRAVPKARPVPRPGDVVILAEPMMFRDGRRLSRFQAVRLPGRTRGVVFRSAEGGLYRISGLKACDYIIEPGPLAPGS